MRAFWGGLFVSLLLVSATPTAANAAVRTVPSTVPADCSVDVTTSLQNYLNTTVLDGDTVQLPSGACYRVDGTITLTDRNNLTFVGLSAGATIREVSAPSATPKVENHIISLVGGSGITFQNLTLRGTNTSTSFDVNREWWHAFEINGTSNVMIDNVDIVDVWGDGVAIQPDTRPSTDVMANLTTVQNSSADRVGRHAVSCTGCTNTVIDGNAFSDIGYHVFDLEVEDNAWFADNVSFTDNTISGYLQHSVVANGGIGNYVTDVTITGNTDTATHQTCTSPVWVLDTAPVKDRWTVSSNTLRSKGPGLSLAGVDHVTVESNLVHLLAGGCTNQDTAVVATNTWNNVVRFNDFQGAGRLVQAGATTSGVACGNRISLAGPNFDRPVAC